MSELKPSIIIDEDLDIDLDKILSDKYTFEISAGSLMSNPMPSGNITINSNSTFSGGSSYITSNWNYTPPKNVISDKGVELDSGQDVKIGDRSLKNFMETVERRLAILVPDPAKLEKFEALKKAYEHYKTLEALCDLNDDNESK